MNLRHLALTPLLAAIALTGCTVRGGKPAAAPANAPVADEVQELRNKNERLQTELDRARKQLEAGNGTAADETKAIAGGPVEGFEPTSRGGLALPDDFAFGKGSAELNDAGEKAIARLATRLNEGDNASAQVIVEGHTDQSPVSRPVTKDKFTDNWGLSAARSASVVRALEKAGINPNRLHGAFRGEHQPRVAIDKDAKDEGKIHDAQAANRRVEIFLGK